MTPEQRIVQLEAELVATRQVVADQARALAEHATREAAESAKREARRRVNRQNYERRKANAVIQTSDSDRIQTLNQTQTPSPPPPSFSLPPPSEPSPSFLYPSSPASPPAASQATSAAEGPSNNAPATSSANLSPEAQTAEKPARKPRTQPPGEALYARLEESRQKTCEEHGVPFVPSRWAFSRQNRELGPIARLPEGHEEQERFAAAWDAFTEDPVALTREPPFSLDWFWKCRSRYEGRAVQAGGT